MAGIDFIKIVFRTLGPWSSSLRLDFSTAAVAAIFSDLLFHHPAPPIWSVVVEAGWLKQKTSEDDCRSCSWNVWLHKKSTTVQEAADRTVQSDVLDIVCKEKEAVVQAYDWLEVNGPLME